MIRTITGREDSTEILRGHNKCLVHLLAISNLNLTEAYLKSAWSVGAVGSNNFYLVTTEAINQAAVFNFSEIFDFQRILIVTLSLSKVGEKVLSEKIANKPLFQKNIRQIVTPNEFAGSKGLFRTMTTWGPKTGLIH